MSTALYVTPKPESAAVLIEVVGAPAGPLDITRTDNNGTSLVRLQENQEPISGALSITDHEAAIEGNITYSVIGTKTNEIANPSFGTDTTGWSNGSGSTITRDTTTGAGGGTTSLKVDTTVAGGYAQYSDKVIIPPELRSSRTKVLLAVYAKGSGTFKVEARGQDAANVTTQTASTAYVALTSVFTRYFVEVTIDENTTKVWPLFFQGTTGTLSFWIDNVLCEINASSTSVGYYLGTLARTLTKIVSLNLAKPVLNVPILANQRQELTSVKDYDSDEESSTTIHYVQDRSDPIVISGPQRARQGTLNIFAASYAESRAIAQLAKSGEVLLFRQPTHQGMDMYLVPNRISTRNGDRLISGWSFEVTVTYTEVKSPTSAQRGSTWNYGEVLNVGTYAEVKAEFPTYRDLVAGP